MEASTDKFYSDKIQWQNDFVILFDRASAT